MHVFGQEIKSSHLKPYNTCISFTAVYKYIQVYNYNYFTFLQNFEKNIELWYNVTLFHLTQLVHLLSQENTTISNSTQHHGLSSSVAMAQQQKQEISLGMTLVAISVLFITCQSVKIIPDLFELLCVPLSGVTDDGTNEKTCKTNTFIDTMIR